VSDAADVAEQGAAHRQALLMEFACLGEPALFGEHQRQIAHRDKGVRMLGADHAQPDPQGLLVQRPSIVQAALPGPRERHVVHRDQRVAVLGAEGPQPGGAHCHMWRLAAGCTRLEPVRGVPAVTFGAELVLLTGTSTITIAPADGSDTAVELAAAAQLREVGGNLSPGPLPPPDPTILPVLDGACGHNPGETGPPVDPGPASAPSTQVPDFTVSQLGGGQLRWADYVGRPVVVMVGDVPHVVKGIQRILHLDAPPPPVVIGLIWKPFGSKDTPAPIAPDRTGSRHSSGSGRLCRHPTPSRVVLR
jgi:hypothetical protein